MKTKQNMKKIKATAAVIAVFTAILVVSGPVIIADTAPQPGSGDEDPIFMSNVTVFLNASDENSGVDFTMYKITFSDGIQINEGDWTVYNGPFVCSNAGDYTIHYYSLDLAGNNETEKTQHFEIIVFDGIPPDTNIDLVGNQIN